MNHQKSIRHGLEVIATLLIALVFAANAAPSANDVIYMNEVIPLDYTTVNICAPENVPISLVGESVTEEKIFVDENGMRSIKGQYIIRATGQDANGVRYTVNGNLNINDKLAEGGPYTEAFTFKLIGQGSIDNFIIRRLVHIRQDGTVKSEFESLCRG